MLEWIRVTEQLNKISFSFTNFEFWPHLGGSLRLTMQVIYMLYIYIILYLQHLADGLIQSDLH